MATVATWASDKYIVESTVVGEAAEWFVLAAKESSENVTDVGVSQTITVTELGGAWSTEASDNGSGTEWQHTFMVPTCYVISKTQIQDDSNYTYISGPCGEVSVLTVSAVWAEASICIEGEERVLAHWTEGGEEQFTELGV